MNIGRGFGWNEIVHSLLWWLKGLIDSLRIGALNYYLKGLRDSIKNLPAIVRGRKVVSPETIMRLKSLSGRLYY